MGTVPIGGQAQFHSVSLEILLPMERHHLHLAGDVLYPFWFVGNVAINKSRENQKKKKIPTSTTPLSFQGKGAGSSHSSRWWNRYQNSSMIKASVFCGLMRSLDGDLALSSLSPYCTSFGFLLNGGVGRWYPGQG